MDAQSGISYTSLPARLVQRRMELRITKAEAARRANVGRMTWWEWEMGRRHPYDANYAGIEDAMQWERGSVQAILVGGEPTERAKPAEPPLLDDNEREIWAMGLIDEDLRREYIRLYRQRRQRPPSDTGSDIA